MKARGPFQASDAGSEVLRRPGFERLLIQLPVVFIAQFLPDSAISALFSNQPLAFPYKSG
jgi:hypothetical protein